MELNIRQKLSAIQNELKAPKNQRNKFGKYNYRSAEDILEAVKPLCHKYKTCLILDDTLVNLGERYYIKATATLLDNESGEAIEVKGYAREEENKKGMDGSQITGASSSYSRKYALNGLFNIDDNKDSDATNTHGNSVSDNKVSKNETVKNKPKKDKSHVKDLVKLKESLKKSKKATLHQLGMQFYLTKEQANDLIKSKLVSKEEISGIVK